MSVVELSGSSATTGATSANVSDSSWWNETYIYRCQVIVSALEETLPVGHPVVVAIDLEHIRDSGKLRSDYADLEVVQSVDPPVSWHWIGREASEGEVCFKLGDTIAPGSSDVYYLHYGNPTPTLVRPSFVPDEWPVQVLQNDPAVGYLKPGKFWRDGVTRVPGAVATFAFFGSSVRVIAIRGPDQAIAEVQVDDQPWVPVDLFFPERTTGEIFRAEHLSPVMHRVRLRATRHANPSAAGRKVELSRFEYVVTMETSLGLEEIYAELWGGGGLGGI